ncbi:MAG: hypothetical protein ABSC48_02295 [Terracidiphilus sp.]|jgi:hypothetical protein
MSLSIIGPTSPEASAPQSRTAPSTPAPAQTSPATLQPDTVTISPQAQKAASSDANHDGDLH